MRCSKDRRDAQWILLCRGHRGFVPTSAWCSQVKVDELDWCWYECVEYGELFCQEQDPPDNPFGNRKLSQFSLGREFSNPLPGSARNTGSTRTGFQSKPIDEYTFEEKCNSVYECRQIEGSGYDG